MLLALVNWKGTDCRDQPRLGYPPPLHPLVPTPTPQSGLSFWLVTCTFSACGDWEREDLGSVNLLSRTGIMGIPFPLVSYIANLSLTHPDFLSRGIPFHLSHSHGWSRSSSLSWTIEEASPLSFLPLVPTSPSSPHSAFRAIFLKQIPLCFFSAENLRWLPIACTIM